MILDELIAAVDDRMRRHLTLVDKSAILHVIIDRLDLSWGTGRPPSVEFLDLRGRRQALALSQIRGVWTDIASVFAAVG